MPWTGVISCRGVFGSSQFTYPPLEYWHPLQADMSASRPRIFAIFSKREKSFFLKGPRKTLESSALFPEGYREFTFSANCTRIVVTRNKSRNRFQAEGMLARSGKPHKGAAYRVRRLLSTLVLFYFSPFVCPMLLG